MKQQFLILFTSLFILSACNGQDSSGPSPETDSQTPTVNESAATENPHSTGAFEYFAKEGPEHFTQTAVEKVCLTPAQLDTTNEGNMFCFTNTEEALKGLKIEADETCKKYMGVATVEIKNLTTDVAAGLKSDACLEDGTCKFNQAEFVQVKEMMDGAKCEKDPNAPQSN